MIIISQKEFKKVFVANILGIEQKLMKTRKKLNTVEFLSCTGSQVKLVSFPLAYALKNEQK